MRATLVFKEGELEALRAALLAEAPNEAAVVVLARPVRSPTDGWRLIAYDFVRPTSADYQVQSPTRVQLSPAFVAGVLKRVERDGASAFFAHSHPFAGVPGPSSVDLAGEAEMFPFLQARAPDSPHGRLIVSPNGFHASMTLPTGENARLRVFEVGQRLVEYYEAPEGAPDSQSTRFDRQVRAFGDEGQRVLRKLNVAVVGAGGTGSLVIQQIAHLGVGSVLLIDPDRVDVTNLNRVAGAGHKDIGLRKVEVATRLIHAIDDAIVVQAIAGDIRDAPTLRNLLDVDFFFCSTDSDGSRAVINQFAYQYLIPGIDMGVVIQVEEGNIGQIAGRVQMLSGGLPCLVCAEVLNSEAVRRDLLSEVARKLDPYIPGEGIAQPAVISINGIAASWAVTMFLAAVVGVPLSTRYLRLRMERGVSSPIGLAPNPSCYVCSAAGAFVRGDSWPTPGRGVPTESR
jgi:molybdopterin/thiamine biosynthesis adenylyltransferase